MPKKTSNLEILKNLSSDLLNNKIDLIDFISEVEDYTEGFATYSDGSISDKFYDEILDIFNIFSDIMKVYAKEKNIEGEYSYDYKKIREELLFYSEVKKILEDNKKKVLNFAKSVVDDKT